MISRGKSFLKWDTIMTRLRCNRMSHKISLRFPFTCSAVVMWSFITDYGGLVNYSDVIMSAMASQINGVSFVQAQIKENIKAPRHWALWGDPSVTGGFPSQRASNAENVSISWRHHLPTTFRATPYYDCHSVSSMSLNDISPIHKAKKQVNLKQIV